MNEIVYVVCGLNISNFLSLGKYLGNAYRHVGHIHAAIEHHEAAVAIE